MSAPVTSSLVTLSDGAEATSVSIAYLPSFYQRVAQIATETAIAICRENDSATIDNHAQRASKALQWLNQASTPAAQINLAMIVAADNITNASSTSQEISDRIAAEWNTYSGL